MAPLSKSPAASLICRFAKRSVTDSRTTISLPLRCLATAAQSSSPTPNYVPPPFTSRTPTKKRSVPYKSHTNPAPNSGLPNKKKYPGWKRGPPPAPIPTSYEPRSAPSSPSRTVFDKTIDPSIVSLLPLLKSQPPFYITAHIHGRPYMVVQGDTIRFPFLMHGVAPGDTLRLNRATLLGSRDYTLKAGEASNEAAVKPGAQGTGDRAEKQAWLDERLFTCRATVLGVESEPMRIKKKTKRRQRHVRKIESKHRYTVVRISELAVNDTDALKEGSIGQGEVALSELEDKMDA
ncbi:hypothetical protein E6O75_ATG08283 [Venturia nashicola]|uniref:Large ribosomal subunit protein bL21m n=1 Tax=Venturia nashicola TaxID=86259 RepID=A0A4Z1NSX1_9PEZI|nr:hypothetical protein E6O75_ATG08283 [Venturia nashicola]